jgi:alkylhydroperoxidase family enzyme
LGHRYGKAPHKIYAHTAAASQVGLSPEQIEELASGRIAAGLSEDELAAQQFTRQLVLDRAVVTMMV